MTTINTLFESKIQTLDSLKEISLYLQSKNKTIIHCHGVFDLLHIGHIRHFEKAKEMGDTLIVTITPDQYVNKGPNRPSFTQELRAEAIAALSCVDYVAINQWPNACNTIALLQPQLYVKGHDYVDSNKDLTQGILLEKEAIEKVGGKLTFTDEISFSSSNLLNRHFSPFSEKMQHYLEKFSKKYSSSSLIQHIKQTKKTKVLLLGETIIDDYVYCRTMGKSGKKPILAVNYEKQETFPGGILAVSNHVSNFSDHVDLLSFLGKSNSYKNFIEENLNEKINANFLTMEEGPTIVKRRYVESYPFQKLFEVYVMENDEGGEKNSSQLYSKLSSCIDDFDLVIVVDYGHGLFSPDVIDLLTKRASYLAVNTQINAGNQGFNTISKYPRADYICLSENEIRMDVRAKTRPLEDIAKEVSEKLQADKMLITRGKSGCFAYSKKEGAYEIPAFAGQAIDRVGSGDAVLSITSLCAKNNAPIEAIGMIGNAVGFMSVQTVCNRSPVDPVALFKFLEHSLK